MKISSASYALASTHIATTSNAATESLRAWVGDRRPNFEAGGKAARSGVSLSSAARASLVADIRATMGALPPASNSQQSQAPEITAIEEASTAVDNDPILSLIRSMVEMLTGKPIRTVSAGTFSAAAAPPAVTSPGARPSTTLRQAASARPAGFGIEYEYHAVHQEAEQTRVSARGTIKANDGREISFTLDLAMARSYSTETSISLRSGDAVRKDPLVLNFDGAAAQLSDQRFSFDLNDSGKQDSLAMLTGGTGYLAIDRNGNGKIDSGRELFGPATNSGFGELSALDGDHNGWIDENDTAFQALRIWTPDASGTGTLETLAGRNVGAIALGSVLSSFELRGNGNSNLGAIAASGLFLKEDGTVGSVQEVNLTI